MPNTLFVWELRALGCPLTAFIILEALVRREYGRRALWKAYSSAVLAVGIACAVGALIVTRHQSQSLLVSQVIVVSLGSLITSGLLSAVLLLLPTVVLSWDRSSQYLFTIHVAVAIAAGLVAVLLCTPVILSLLLWFSCVTGVGCI
jgi:hypothetical protein